jgi:hypothetical protein
MIVKDGYEKFLPFSVLAGSGPLGRRRGTPRTGLPLIEYSVSEVKSARRVDCTDTEVAASLRPLD